MNIWGNFEVSDDSYHFRQIGPLKFWVRNKNNEWLIAHDRFPEEKESLASEVLKEGDESISWKRFIISDKERVIYLSPVTPGRAIVVKPESELKISSGSEALFFLLFPAKIKISVGTKKNVITELSSQILSNTWFGEPDSGELCYSLKTSARRTIEGLTPRPHQVVCPVYIKNNSQSDLNFKRLCIRTEYLSIYQGENWLWSNKVHVSFRGDNHVSKIKYNSSVPDFEKIHGLLSPPRSKPVKDFSLKSFDTFKFLTGA